MFGVTVIGGLIVVDHYNHDFIANTPLITSVVESTYSAWDCVKSFFHYKPEGGVPTTSTED